MLRCGKGEERCGERYGDVRGGAMSVGKCGERCGEDCWGVGEVGNGVGRYGDVGGVWENVEKSVWKYVDRGVGEVKGVAERGVGK